MGRWLEKIRTPLLESDTIISGETSRRVGNSQYEQALQYSGQSRDAQNADEFEPWTERQAKAFQYGYQNDLELWDRFWQFMADECDRGAPSEYVLGCSEVLEKVWQANGGFEK